MEDVGVEGEGVEGEGVEGEGVEDVGWRVRGWRVREYEVVRVGRLHMLRIIHNLCSHKRRYSLAVSFPCSHFHLVF